MNGVYSIFPPGSKQKIPPKYKKHICFLSKHSSFKNIIKLVGPIKPEIPIWKSIDDAVLYSVIGQMLSGSAAGSIIKRLLNDFGSSSAVIRWTEKNSEKKGPLKGISQRKRKALCEWKRYKKNNGRKYTQWAEMPLEKYREEITSIWGFGRWSADMIAIFHLGRMDIWPETDGGIQRACRRVFPPDERMSIKKYIKGSETVAAIYLWELINRNLLSNFTKG